jgi:hypothetical protein
MSAGRNWDSLAGECAPPPGTKGGEAHSPTAEGLGESQFLRLEKKLSTLPTLCCLPSSPFSLLDIVTSHALVALSLELQHQSFIQFLCVSASFIIIL